MITTKAKDRIIHFMEGMEKIDLRKWVVEEFDYGEQIRIDFLNRLTTMDNYRFFNSVTHGMKQRIIKWMNEEEF